jgi:two-component system OmpR family response regulator
VKVLVVEDEERMAALLQRGLSEDGHTVDVASDGPDGLWRAVEHHYDAIVLDVMLPGMDGFEICRRRRRLRRAERWTPVLMLTARSAVPDRIGGLDAGADDYLLKPFVFGELTARLRALARRGEVPRPTTLTVRDITLDPATRAVVRAGEELSLTAREHALLELLLRNAGLVLSRDQVRRAVWGHDADPGSNVVDQYVGYLRRKLAQPGRPPDIETSRGFGYRLRS